MSLILRTLMPRMQGPQHHVACWLPWIQPLLQKQSCHLEVVILEKFLQDLQGYVQQVPAGRNNGGDKEEEKYHVKDHLGYLVGMELLIVAQDMKLFFHSLELDKNGYNEMH